MTIPIFLSYPRPHVDKQVAFIDELTQYLVDRGLEPRTLGVTEYDNDAPLTAIRRLMLESNGLITVALRRTWIEKAISRRGANVDGAEESTLSDTWLSSPFCHIEPAMAFQLGLPILLLREQGVVADGILEKGVVGMYMPHFSLDKTPTGYLKAKEWTSLIAQWESQVRAVRDAKGRPPRLYG
jgi:hypothetical protein